MGGHERQNLPRVYRDPGSEPDIIIGNISFGETLIYFKSILPSSSASFFFFFLSGPQLLPDDGGKQPMATVNHSREIRPFARVALVCLPGDFNDPKTTRRAHTKRCTPARRLRRDRNTVVARAHLPDDNFSGPWKQKNKKHVIRH